MAVPILEDLRRLLLSTDASDTDGLRPIARQLDEIARVAPPVQKRMLEEAIGAIDRITADQVSDGDATLKSAVRFLDAAAAMPSASASLGSAISPVSSPEVPTPKAPFFVFDEADRELIVEFVTESLDYLTQAEGAMLVLESTPTDGEAVDTVFRAFHTVKGVSAMLGLDPISTLAHKAESLLSQVRSKELHFSGEAANLSLSAVDTIKALVEGLNSTLAGEAWDPPSHLAALADALGRTTGQGVSKVVPCDSDIPLAPSLEAPAPHPIVAEPFVAEPVVTQPVVTQPVPAQPVVTQTLREPEPQKADPTREPLEAAVDKAARTPAGAATGRSDNESQSVRIRTERLDRLVDMVGELVIAHSMVRQDPTLARGEHIELTRKVAHAGKIVRELQELAMSLRMVPLKPTFQKLARVVRDTAQKSGKTVELVVAGEETEIDRNMVDIIADPLVHMLRNAVDHGIEAPEARAQSGKSRSGTITLSALHSGGNVVVVLRDDGAGLDRTRIVRKAIERGLIDSDAQMNDSDVFALIFEPGFSTRDQVTDVSGRGVGMDVVRRNVQALNGRIEIASTLGAGTTFTLRLPLTLAVTDGMLVRVGDERFIVPTVNIQTSLRPLPEQLSTVSCKGELLFIRGDLIPMFRLHRLFDLAGATEDPTKALAVVVNGVEGRCALLVDELLGQQQVVAKSLGEGIGNVRGIAGGAILGDGRVGLILDTPEIIALARERASERDHSGAIN